MQDAPNSATLPEPDRQGRLVPVEQQSTATWADPYASPGYSNDHLTEAGEFSKTFRYYVALLAKHKWIILSCGLVFPVLGGLYTSMKTPLYTSTARIQIDRQSIKVVEQGTTSSGETQSYDFHRTQYELLKSRSMAKRVVSRLSLEHDKTFFEPRNPSLLGTIKRAILPPPNPKPKSLASLQSSAASIVRANVSIKPVNGSRLVDLRYKDPSPERAQRVANAYVQAYLDSNIDKRFQANKYARTFLGDQIKQLKIRLEASENELLQFAEREKIITTNEQASIAESNLAAANVALGRLVGERIKNEQLWQQVNKTKAITLPQFLSNSVIDTLRAQRKELVKGYQEKLETFKPGYPAMRRIKKQINEIDRQLASEITTIRSSLKGAFENAASQENETRARIEKLRAEVLKLQKKRIRYNILKREADSNRGLYKDLLKRSKEVDIAAGVGVNNVFVVDAAQLPGAPSEPRLMRVLFLALILGLSSGIGLAYAIELLDDRVASPKEVEQLTGLATLGIIPYIDSDEEFSEGLENPRSSIAEAYRTLGTALQFSTSSGLPSSIAVTSSGPGEGKSSTSFALARHFASLGLKVLLVDCDMRKPSLHTRLGLDNSVGMSNYLTGSVQPPDVIRKTDIPNLAFIASGPLPPNPAELLGGTHLFSMMSIGLEVFDLIVIDSPPMLGLADAQLVANAVSSTLFVVGSGHQRKDAITDAIRRLHVARTPLSGAVLTKFDTKDAGYGYEYYGYGQDAYGHQYASIENEQRA